MSLDVLSGLAIVEEDEIAEATGATATAGFDSLPQSDVEDLAVFKFLALNEGLGELVKDSGFVALTGIIRKLKDQTPTEIVGPQEVCFLKDVVDLVSILRAHRIMTRSFDARARAGGFHGYSLLVLWG
jgi:uracil phosphoribosyltransferase